MDLCLIEDNDKYEKYFLIYVYRLARFFVSFKLWLDFVLGLKRLVVEGGRLPTPSQGDGDEVAAKWKNGW